MKIACIFIILCAVAVISTAAEISLTFNNPASAPERNSRSALAVIDDKSNEFELATKRYIQDAENNQRGKGSNGGGSITRQPRTRNSAVTLKGPSIFTSLLIVISSVFLLLVLPFVIP